MKSVIGFTSFKLSICALTLMLTACGGGGGDSQSSSDGGANNGATDSEETGGLYPEPMHDIADSTSIGFYDFNAADEIRKIRPDLEGDFQAMVQFGQSHVVDPNGSDAKKNAPLNV